VTKCDISPILTSHIMNCLIYVIGKAITPLFADPVCDSCSIHACFNNALYLISFFHDDRTMVVPVL